MNTPPRNAYWTQDPEKLLVALESSVQGLSDDVVAARTPHKTRHNNGPSAVLLLLAQFKTPIVLMLIAAAGLSFYLRDNVDGSIILGIVVASGLLGFWQEYGAMNAVHQLMARVRATVQVLRNGKPMEVAVDHVVRGDVVLLSAGSLVPADCRLLEAKDLFVNEATLTGETFPVEKSPGTIGADTPLAQRHNGLFMGTNVISGTCKAIAVLTGSDTELGHIAGRLAQAAPETQFEHGVRRFGFLLTEVTLVMVVLIFGLNVYLGKPVMETFMFSLALAVGLTPQLLPAVISVNLARGAKRMAKADVIVKRLSAIENFGSMDVLCSDKTGTLTQGKVHVHGAMDVTGRQSEVVLREACLNATLESGFANPIDEGLRAMNRFDFANVEKLDEIPYDFLRKRLSVLVAENGVHRLVAKGALAQMLDVCRTAATDRGEIPLDECRAAIDERYHELSAQGYRVLGVANRVLNNQPRIQHDAETDMVFQGFLVLEDPPKVGVETAIAELKSLGVSLKLITGDNHLAASHLSHQIGLGHEKLLTGNDLRNMSDEALLASVSSVDIFAEVEPNQKERIILAYRKAGHVVGFLGDGINDASALHAADVGISVDSAVDVAKEAAHFVLLRHDLSVLAAGVREGRTTFANTLKYVFMATSANFGNMFSMAGASLFLPFLPLLPKQVLLTNLLTDIPEMAIATDRVDAALVEKPERWDIGFVRRFMIVFGLLSSCFDYATFGVLMHLGADANTFRTGWFLESVFSATFVVLVIRTRLPFFQSLPSRALLGSTFLVWILVLGLTYSPLAKPLGFTRLPTQTLMALGALVFVYVVAAELAKHWFYQANIGKTIGIRDKAATR